MERSFLLPVSILAGRPVVPGVEGDADLRAAMCSWSIPCHFMVRRPDGLVLTTELSTPWGDLLEHVDLESVRRASGGDSYYFVCPGPLGHSGCGRQVRNLHLPLAGVRVLACRECHGLMYRSQSTRVRTIPQMREWLGRYKERMGYPVLPTAASARIDGERDRPARSGG